jgi:tRNA threonylcarbamoyladenosine biosynthesis protein TsaE
MRFYAVEKFISKSYEETVLLGKKFAEGLEKEIFIALYGDLGAGKTAFVKGMVKSFLPDAIVTSPTYNIVNTYTDGNTVLHHYDMYRISDEDDLYSTGFYDYLDSNAVCLVEWSENIRYAFPKKYLTVRIEKNDMASVDSRMITVMLEDAK